MTLANTLMQTAHGKSFEIAGALLEAIREQDDPEQDNTSFVVVKLDPKEAEVVVDADDLPVLAMADGPSGAPAAPAAAPAASAAPAAEEKDERKAYWYRGQKYYRD